MKRIMSLSNFLTEYVERNDNNQYIPVAVGRYGIRKREDIYSKEGTKARIHESPSPIKESRGCRA